MPELPELETYRRLLTPLMAGRTVTAVELTRERSVNVAAKAFAASVTGRRVEQIDRRAKQLLFRLDDGRLLLLHLMLSGLLLWSRNAPERTVQVRLSLGADSLHFVGLRLGYLHLLTEADAEVRLSKLGPEPLEASFTNEAFAALTKRKRGTLKTALPDQSFLAGIGNCYSDEICFSAGLKPSRELPMLSDAEIGGLYSAIRTVLTEAVRWGGYMETPLFEGDQLTGGFDERCRVYDREGEPCVRCGIPIVREDVYGKKSFHCPRCQR